MTTHPEDGPRVEQLAAELLGKPGLALELPPHLVLMLVGMIQLALRHPALGVEARGAGVRLLASAIQYFEAIDAPTAVALVHEGNDPAHDRRPT